MKTIPLSKGQVALVDDADYERVSKFNWFARKSSSGKFYGVRNSRSSEPGTKVSLHRYVMDAPPGKMLDHRDGNTLNCCRSNLRYCDRAENSRNRGKSSNNSSGYKGVHKSTNTTKWRVQIRHDYELLFLGYYTDAKEAALVYDAAARRMHGSFARLNFPEQP